MKFAAHFKYDREITLWLSGFIGRALPGTCFPEEVEYELRPAEPMLDAEAYRLFMTLDVDDGEVDIAVTMVVHSFDFLFRRAPQFERLEITRDLQDASGNHIKTLVWNDCQGKWIELDDPFSDLSVIDGGFSS